MGRRAGRRGWAWRATLWISVLMLVLATAGLQLVIRPQLADDPRVGSGRLDAPEVAPPPDAVLLALPEVTGSATPAGVRTRLDALNRDGLGDAVALVLDARTGTELYRTGQGPRTPASSLKVLSALAALDVLGPGATFRTTTLLAGDALVLRGGGDPLLTSARTTGYPRRASLEQLAADTATALKARGIASVSLAYDASLFAGPGWNPSWPDIFARSVAPITALTADHARPNLAALDRVPDPSRFAADRFAGYLAAAGISVSAINPAAAPAGAQELAAATSPTAATIAERILVESDNDAAETLLWQAALASGQPASPAGGAATLQARLQARGLWTPGMAVVDGNGISESNQVSTDALVGAVRLALTEPALRAVATGLPVAGVSGTLTGRFAATDALTGRGLVRAKTGTIRGVNTLTGYVVTADGQPLAFALMTSGGAGQTSARAWLDRASAALASCGC